MVDYESLKKLETLKEDGIIDQAEYEAKIKKLFDFVSVDDETKDVDAQSSGTNAMTGSSGSMLPWILVALLVIACIVITSQWINLGDELKAKDTKISSLNNEIDGLRGYKYAVKDFYLDNAVLVVEGDGSHYHRYDCSTIPMTYTYWLYNVDAARDLGYVQCPTCFGEIKDSYCKKHFE